MIYDEWKQKNLHLFQPHTSLTTISRYAFNDGHSSANVKTTPMYSVYTQLRSIRKSKNIKLRALEDYSGVNYSYISAVESGKRNPSVAVLLKLVRALGYDLVLVKKDD